LRNGLLDTGCRISLPYRDSGRIIFIHAPEEVENRGKKKRKKQQRERVIRVFSDPLKMWDRARRSLYFSFFSTANSPHASSGSPVYKGTRVLEMMASVEKKKGRSARVSRSDTCITLFIPRLCPRKCPTSPSTLRQEKPLPLFFLFSIPVPFFSTS